MQKIAADRITPADAGKTQRAVRLNAAGQDHPRGCGENAVLGVCLSPPVGSPPRMRGKPDYTYVAYSDGGITPADAGKT